MTGRARWAVLGVVVAVVVALTAAFALRAVDAQQSRLTPTAATARDRALELGAVLDAPHVVFLSTAPGPTYGRLAAVPLADPSGARSVSSLACDRVYATASAGVCLAAHRGGVTTYSADLLDRRLDVTGPTPITGIPDRARVSPDGSLAATTTFTGGHGYGTIDFSTRTTIVDVATRARVADLEKDYATVVDGRRVTARDLNAWGVTFASGPHPTSFFATVSTGGSTWLVHGDTVARTLTSVRPDAECPSLSPDGTRLVYKKRAGSPVAWRYAVLDLRTGRETPLVETRSVDDQAEWLDDGRVLYGLPRSGSGETDVWVAGVAADAPAPRVFLPDAWSPAVVRGAP